MRDKSTETSENTRLKNSSGIRKVVGGMVASTVADRAGDAPNRGWCSSPLLEKEKRRDKEERETRFGK